MKRNLEVGDGHQGGHLVINPQPRTHLKLLHFVRLEGPILVLAGLLCTLVHGVAGLGDDVLAVDIHLAALVEVTHFLLRGGSGQLEAVEANSGNVLQDGTGRGGGGAMVCIGVSFVMVLL